MITVLNEQVQVTSVNNGSGVATATGRIGPSRYGETWHITLMTTQSNSTTDVELRVYRNVESPGSMVDSTYSGRSATSPCDLKLRVGESLVAVWSKGDIGAIHTLRVEGENQSARMG